MNFSQLEQDQIAALETALQQGMAPFGAPDPLTLEEWATKNFYLSAESSYVEQDWTAWTFQRAILHCMGNDDIREVDFKKSARVGYTKMLLAAMCYFAEHKRRNQCIWQPTDEDRDEFVKAEFDTVLRDIKVMRKVLPSYLSRHKDNTLQQKKFIGSLTHMKGGKAAKNYRRISIDIAELDEIDAFDDDIEKEGDPYTLASKRVEGATYPKIIVGSTPKLKATSKIDARYLQADERFTFQSPCPNCGERHALTWGGKDVAHGFKFTPGNAESVVHMCPHCGIGYTQAQYLKVEHLGVWVNEDGTIHLHGDGRFTTPDGISVPTPRHIAFHLWTAYSPAVAWTQIVSEFFAAMEAFEKGDDAKLKAWTNTTQGECWVGDVEHTDVDELKQRAEPYPKRYMPRDCLLLLCACDVQGNRVEAQVWGYGSGGQMWDIDHKQFFGNPEQPEVWQELEEYLFGETFQHASGTNQQIFATAIDANFCTNAVYAFAHKHRGRRVYAVRGSPGDERGIENGNTKVGFNWQGKRERHGVILWHIGTNLAKDRFAARLEIKIPGSGYVHLNAANTDEWFEQLAAEDRHIVRTKTGDRSRWTPHRKRNEIIDMTGYCIWLEERLQLWATRKKSWWIELENQVQPAITDMFAAPPAAPELPPVTDPLPPPAPRPPAAPSRRTADEDDDLYAPMSMT